MHKCQLHFSMQASLGIVALFATRGVSCGCLGLPSASQRKAANFGDFELWPPEREVEM